jgi:hypothetical protein
LKIPSDLEGDGDDEDYMDADGNQMNLEDEGEEFA